MPPIGENLFGPEGLGTSLKIIAVLSALSLMTRRRIRHLPVVEGERIVGIVSIGDLVKYRMDQIEADAAAMLNYIQSV